MMFARAETIGTACITLANKLIFVKGGRTQYHQIWDNARKVKNIEFLPLDESEKVIQYLEDKKVKPIPIA